jgi:hypothetical protein
MAVQERPFDVEVFDADLLLLTGKKRTFRQRVLSYSPFWTARRELPETGNLHDAVRAFSPQFSSLLASGRLNQGSTSTVRGRYEFRS